MTRAAMLGLVDLLCVARLPVAAAQEKPAPAFYVADFAVTDREGIKPYSEEVEFLLGLPQ